MCFRCCSDAFSMRAQLGFGVFSILFDALPIPFPIRSRCVSDADSRCILNLVIDAYPMCLLSISVCFELISDIFSRSLHLFSEYSISTSMYCEDRYLMAWNDAERLSRRLEGCPLTTGAVLGSADA